MQRTRRQRITKTAPPTAVRQICNAIMVVNPFIQACCNYFAKRGKCQKSLTYWTVFDTPRLTPRAHWCNGVDMATATYDSKHGRWDLSWKKPAAQGSKYAYGRKRITDKTYPTLGAREQKKLQKEMDARAAALEQAEQGNAPEPPKSAWAELASVKRVCAGADTKAEKYARQVVDKFAAWLREKHPAAVMADIGASMLAEYTAHLITTMGLTAATARLHLLRLRWVIQSKGYTCSWAAMDLLKDYARQDEVYSREEITPDEFGFILREILTGDTIADSQTAYNVFAMFYLGICTSWRRGDIVNKTWADVYLPDLSDNTAQDYGTIRNRHHKTKNKSGAVSTIRLTRVARVVLDGLREINGDSKTIIHLGKDNNESAQTHCNRLFELLRDKYNKARIGRHARQLSTVSYHSLRTTAISYNIKAGLQESLVCSLAGHAPANIERKHYIKYSPDDYRLCVRSLEDGFVLPVYDKIKHDRDKIKPIFGGVLEAIRLADSYAVDYSKFEDKREVKMVVDKLRRAGFFAALQSMPITYNDIKLAFEHLRA